MTICDEYWRELVDLDLVKKHMLTLTTREQKILTFRFGLDGGNWLSQSECAVELGVTRERIRQLERQIIQKLKVRIELENERDIS